MEIKEKKSVWKFVMYAAICAAFLLIVINFGQIVNVLKVLVGIAKPLIIGVVIAFVLNIIMSGLEKIYFRKSTKKIVIKTRRPVCLILAIIAVLAIIALVLKLVIPALIDAFKLLADNVIILYDKIYDFIIKHEDQFPQIAEKIQSLNINWSTIGENVMSFLKGGIGTVFGSTFTIITSVFGTVVDIFVALIFGIFILSGKEKLKSQINRTIAVKKPKKYDTMKYIYHTAYSKFRAFVVGQFTEAVILGTLCTIGMLIFRFPYAGVVGVLVGFTALIPIAGAYIGAIVGVLLIFTVSPIKALLFVVFLVVLQQIEGNVIYPKVVGTSIGLPGIWVFIAVIIGGGIAGIPGMLLGVPIMATIFELTKKYVGKKEVMKKEALKINDTDTNS